MAKSALQIKKIEEELYILHFGDKYHTLDLYYRAYFKIPVHERWHRILKEKRIFSLEEIQKIM